jgi:hypothetical protein
MDAQDLVLLSLLMGILLSTARYLAKSTSKWHIQVINTSGSTPEPLIIEPVLNPVTSKSVHQTRQAVACHKWF